MNQNKTVVPFSHFEAQTDERLFFVGGLNKPDLPLYGLALLQTVHLRSMN